MVPVLKLMAPPVPAIGPAIMALFALLRKVYLIPTCDEASVMTDEPVPQRLVADAATGWLLMVVTVTVFAAELALQPPAETTVTL